jgi:hypothetical protein
MIVILPRTISCDEAGFTGNHMLDDAQPHFAYTSHDLMPDDAADILADARERFPVQMPELKARQLLKTDCGRGLVMHVLGRIRGRYMTTLSEKRLSFACKFFEHVYEPVLQHKKALFYNQPRQSQCARRQLHPRIQCPASASGCPRGRTILADMITM